MLFGLLQSQEGLVLASDLVRLVTQYDDRISQAAVFATVKSALPHAAGAADPALSKRQLSKWVTRQMGECSDVEFEHGMAALVALVPLVKSAKTADHVLGRLKDSNTIARHGSIRWLAGLCCRLVRNCLLKPTLSQWKTQCEVNSFLHHHQQSLSTPQTTNQYTTNKHSVPCTTNNHLCGAHCEQLSAFRLSKLSLDGLQELRNCVSW